MERQVTGECSSCESHYTIAFVEEIVSEELPEYCPSAAKPLKPSRKTI